MPIKKENRSRYPWNWRKISYYIIHVRAKDKCEGVLDNGERCNADNHKPHPVTGKMVVLSVAHLDHTPEHSDDENNMKAFCQVCHNRWDRQHRNESIKETYRIKHGVEEEKQGLVFYDTPNYDGAPNAGIKFDEAGQYDAGDMALSDGPREEYMVDELKDMIRHLLTLIPSGEAAEYTILLKSLELKEDLIKMMNLPTGELNTLAVQTKINVLKQKQGIIEQLVAVSKILSKTTEVVRGTKPVKELKFQGPAETASPIADNDDVDLRGLGIKTLMRKRNG